MQRYLKRGNSCILESLDSVPGLRREDDCRVPAVSHEAWVQPEHEVGRTPESGVVNRDQLLHRSCLRPKLKVSNPTWRARITITTRATGSRARDATAPP